MGHDVQKRVYGFCEKLMNMRAQRKNSFGLFIIEVDFSEQLSYYLLLHLTAITPSFFSFRALCACPVHTASYFRRCAGLAPRPVAY
jgi:hypothetical protein